MAEDHFADHRLRDWRLSVDGSIHQNPDGKINRRRNVAATNISVSGNQKFVIINKTYTQKIDSTAFYRKNKSI